jgi:hypothetical protein
MNQIDKIKAAIEAEKKAAAERLAAAKEQMAKEEAALEQADADAAKIKEIEDRYAKLEEPASPPPPTPPPPRQEAQTPPKNQLGTAIIKRIANAPRPVPPIIQPNETKKARKKRVVNAVFNVSRFFSTYDYDEQVLIFICVLLGCMLPNPPLKGTGKLYIDVVGRGNKRRVDREGVRTRLHVTHAWVTWLLAVVCSAPESIRLITRIGDTNEYDYTDLGLEVFRSRNYYRIVQLAQAHRALYGEGEDPKSF